MGEARHRTSGWRRGAPHRVGAVLACGAVVLTACGQTPGQETSPRDPAQGGTVAPECHEVDRLQATLPEGIEPTGTTAEPIEDGSVPGSASEGDGALPDALTLAPEIERWAQREAADSFAGVWVDQELGGFAVAFARDVDRYAAEVRDRIHPGLAVADANHSYAELRDLQDRITEEQMGQPDHESGAVRSTGVDVLSNRAALGVFDPDADRLAELSETYDATAICFEIEAAPGPPAEAIDTLAKAQGWRDGLTEEAETMFAVFEVAYDRETAQAAWRDNVPDDLAPRDDELPAEAGVYGALDEVDFDQQAVVVWSSGESGSCPEWLTDIDGADGIILVQRDATAEMCTDDYNPYRLVLAVDRDRLPAPDDLAAARLEGVPDGTIRTYATEGDGGAA